MKIVIGCPANRFTGGPTLAHQLCYELRSIGHDASMYYYHRRGHKSLVHKNYIHLELPVSLTLVDQADLIFVAPETNVRLLNKIKKGKRVLWWMSVDNYYDKYKMSRKYKFLTLYGCFDYKFGKRHTYHLVQSQYARDFLANKGITQFVYNVSDFLNDDFLAKAELCKQDKRSDIVLYSPKRGLEVSKLLMDLTPNLKWVPLENMTQEQMIKLMLKSKVYVDFGNHPGKDRIPREAALMGCVIVTGTRGSAGNDIDVNIPKEYKFNSPQTDTQSVLNLIHNILSNFDVHYENMSNYRNKIINEKAEFRNEVKEAFTAISRI